jgi:hypothetical protein
MPRGLNRSDINDGGTSYRNGTPLTLPHNFGNPAPPESFGNPIPSSGTNQNVVNWLPSPAHFGNQIGSTNPAPTVISLDITSGPPAGGTSVTATGTGFLSGAEVLFGDNPATSVVVNSSTSITCDTPAGTASTTVNVEVINTDSQYGVLDNAWTYANQQATPTFSPAAGAYTTPQFLQILSEGADDIYYTLDGSTPTDSSPQYIPGGHIVGIEANGTVKALATQSGYSDSDIGSAAYTFDLAPAYLRQSDAWGQAGEATTSLESSYFEVGRYPFLPIQAGDALVLVVSVCGEGSAANINGMNVLSVTDNYGNTWTQVPGARKSQSGFFSQFIDVWVAYDVAAVPEDGLQITATTDTAVGDSSSAVGVTTWDCVGLTGGTPTVATGSYNDSTGGFTAPSINAGASSLVISAYPYILAGVIGVGDVASPFDVFVSSSTPNATTGSGGSQQSCSAVVSGTVAPVWIGLSGEGYSGILTEVAFPAVT